LAQRVGKVFEFRGYVVVDEGEVTSESISILYSSIQDVYGTLEELQSAMAAQKAPKPMSE